MGRKGKTLGAEPEPDLADRTRFSELFEDTVNGFGDSLIRMEEDFAVIFPPEKANREASSQLSPGGLIADASLESGTDDMQFSFGHSSFQSEKEPIVKESGVVEAIFVADQGVGDAAQIEESIPIGHYCGLLWRLRWTE